MTEATTPPPKRSRLPRWLKVTILATLVVANLVVLAIIWVVRTGNTLLEDATVDDEVAGVLDQSTTDHLTFLIVGSDSREGIQDLTNIGEAAGARGDVILLVRLDPKTSTAQMLSIPRDLYVDIPGRGKNKVNAAYAYGGPSLMVETIKSNLGIEVNHYVEIDFLGFQDMIDELGGVEIAFPYPARDLKSGLDVAAGEQRLDGRQALAYVRSRGYQELQDGSWVHVEANDFGRTHRQQTVIRAIISEMKKPSSIVEAGNIASAMAQHMTIDANLANASVASLVWDYKGILTGSIDGATLPGIVQKIDGASVVLASQPEADEMLANFRAGRPFASQPVRVEVLNGNGSDGAAGDLSRRLSELGFVVGSIGNAGRDDYLQTTVIVPQGSGNGQDIVGALGFGVVEFGSVDNGYDAVVIVGSDAS